MGTKVRKEIYSLFHIYIYFVWVKISSERDILILAGVALKAMCILNILQKLHAWEKCGSQVKMRNAHG